MTIKAVAVDDQNTQHLIIGLNRENVNSLLDGCVHIAKRGGDLHHGSKRHCSSIRRDR
jgi:hypothetical protein